MSQYLVPSVASRQHIHLSWAEMAGTAGVESTLTNFSAGTRGGTALTAATNYAVSTGKTLRIQEIHVYIKATSTVLNWGHLRLRQAASSIANTSPIIWQAQLGHPSATAAGNELAALPVTIADGMEIAATQQITFTWLTTANTCTVGLALTGFEY